MMILRVAKNNNKNINIKLLSNLNNKSLVLMETIHLILLNYNQLTILIKKHN